MHLVDTAVDGRLTPEQVLAAVDTPPGSSRSSWVGRIPCSGSSGGPSVLQESAQPTSTASTSSGAELSARTNGVVCRFSRRQDTHLMKLPPPPPPPPPPFPPPPPSLSPPPPRAKGLRPECGEASCADFVRSEPGRASASAIARLVLPPGHLTPSLQYPATACGT